MGGEYLASGGKGWRMIVWRGGERGVSVEIEVLVKSDGFECRGMSCGGDDGFVRECITSHITGEDFAKFQVPLW